MKQLVCEVFQFGTESVPCGHHTNRLSILDDRDVSKTALVHDVKRMP